MTSWRKSWRQIEPLLLYILLGILIFYLFSYPDQVHEIYRAIAQEFAWEQKFARGKENNYRELIVAGLGIIAVSFALWLTARQTTMLAARDQKAFSRWVPRLLAIVAPAAAAVGLFNARVDPKVADPMQERVLRPLFVDQFLDDQLQLPNADISLARNIAEDAADRAVAGLTSFNYLLLLFAEWLVILAVVMFLVVSLLDQSATVSKLVRPRLLYTSWVSRLFIVLGAGLIGLFIINPVDVPQQIGIIGLLGLFLCFLLFAIAQLHTWGRRLNIPLIAIVLLYAFFISWFDWNDNHAIRIIQTEGYDRAAHTTLGDAFKKWWKEREDKDQDKFQGQKRYPVYIVAAQGGGIYAADHVAEFLAGMQDLCPNFAHHVFAISGVSGGSVGATAFAGLTRELGNLKEPMSANWMTCFPAHGGRPTLFVDTITEVFQKDLLSPLAASLFFPDFFQRFFPVPIERLDRARALEYAFEDAYARAINNSGLAKRLARPAQTLAIPFHSHWDPETYPHTPALVLNTTEVGSGERQLISPFTFEGAGLAFLPIWSDNLPPPGQQQITLPLSTAAVLSARFPWVTPAGWFREVTDDEGSTRKVRLVDGGYFENSGVATAGDIIESLIRSIKKQDLAKRIEIELIVFSSADFQKSRQYGLAETLEPIRAMLNTRSARAGIEVDKALNRMRSLSSEGVGVSARLVKLELQGHHYPLPLGWRLSPITRHLISYQNGLALKCDAEDIRVMEMETGRGLDAGCVKKLIFDKLN